MKTTGREINVFNISALDLFASALGAFILIAIVLIPFFSRAGVAEELEKLNSELESAQEELREVSQRLQQSQSDLQRSQADLQQCRESEAACQQQLEAAQAGADEQIGILEQAQREIQQCQAELEACTERLASTFLAVVIQWGTDKHDVDLHVIDAAGMEFYYERRTIPGRPGELSVDTQDGPGVEIWEVPAAPPGTYQVLYNLYNKHGNLAPAGVKGGVYYRDGHVPLHWQELTRVGRSNAVPVADITVENDGTVTVIHR